MANPTLSLLQYLRITAAALQVDTRSDSELLNRYAKTHDETAFAILVARHGPLVATLCRQILGNAHDAEDAFQSTFLALSQRAETIRIQKTLAGWLQQVAQRSALNLRQAKATRQRLREQLQTLVYPYQSQPSSIEANEAYVVLHEELGGLREKLRVPLVLHYYEGKSKVEIARMLGISESAVRHRLQQAKSILEQRLIQRGITVGVASITSLLQASSSQAAVSATLVRRTVESVLAFRAGTLSGSTAELACQVLKSLPYGIGWLSKAGLVAILCVSILGARAYLWQTATEPLSDRHGNGPVAASVQEKVSQQRDQGEVSKTRLDLYGDPLPPGALTRLGTVRFRPGSGITSFAFTPDGKGVKPSNVRRGVLGITSLAFTPDGKGLLAAAYRNGLEIGKPISLWERDTGKLLRRFGDFPNFCSAAICAHGRIVAGWQSLHPTSHPGHPEDILCLWEVTTGKLLNQFKGKSIRRHYAVSPNGKFLATDLDGKFGIWNIDSGQPLWERKFRGLDAVAISPDSSIVALSALKRDKNGGLKNIICFWEVRTGKLLRTREDDSEKGIFNVTNIAFSCDGNKLAVQSYNNKEPGMIHLLDRITGKVTLLGESEAGMVCSPTNMIVATYKKEGGFCRWDMDTGKKLRHVADFRPGRQRNPLVFSSDGKILAGIVGMSEREHYCLLGCGYGERTPALSRFQPSLGYLGLFSRW